MSKMGAGVRGGLGDALQPLTTTIDHQEHNIIIFRFLRFFLMLIKGTFSDIFWVTQHPIFMTAMDRYQLKIVAFKIPVSWNFALARYAGFLEFYFSIKDCTVIKRYR